MLPIQFITILTEIILQVIWIFEHNLTSNGIILNCDIVEFHSSLNYIPGFHMDNIPLHFWYFFLEQTNPYTPGDQTSFTHYLHYTHSILETPRYHFALHPKLPATKNQPTRLLRLSSLEPKEWLSTWTEQKAKSLSGKTNQNQETLLTFQGTLYTNESINH